MLGLIQEISAAKIYLTVRAGSAQREGGGESRGHVHGDGWECERGSMGLGIGRDVAGGGYAVVVVL